MAKINSQLLSQAMVLLGNLDSEQTTEATEEIKRHCDEYLANPYETRNRNEVRRTLNSLVTDLATCAQRLDAVPDWYGEDMRWEAEFQGKSLKEIAADLRAIRAACDRELREIQPGPDHRPPYFRRRTFIVALAYIFKDHGQDVMSDEFVRFANLVHQAATGRKDDLGSNIELARKVIAGPRPRHPRRR